MTKDEARRQIQLKRDCVADARGALRVAEQQLVETIERVGLAALGLQVGDTLVDQKGRTYRVVGAREGFMQGQVTPRAVLVKADKTIGTREMSYAASWEKVEP